MWKPSKPALRMHELSDGGISEMNACRTGDLRWVIAVTSKTSW
jgi:hypothetical protein